MMRIQNILYPTDFSRCADQALSHAEHLARHFEAEIFMLHVQAMHEEDPYNPDHYYPDAAEVQKRIARVTEDRMNALTRSHGLEHARVHQVQVRGLSTAPTILDFASDRDIDLVVMGTHGRRGVQHLFLGSVAEEVVRHAACPVMTIRERKASSPAIETIARILVPVDFSDHSLRAIWYAKELASSYQATLQLLHIVEETLHPAFYNMGVMSIYDVNPDIEQEALTALDDAFQKAGGPDVPYETHVRKGRASRDIVNHATESGSDMIVIATHGLSGIEHLMIGSVTEKVVRRAPCPVFTMKPFGKSLIS